VKSLVESVMRDLSVKYVIQPSSVGTYLEGRGADVIVDGACIGNFGEMHPQVIVDFELGYPIAAFELDLEAMTEGTLERVA